MRIACVKSSKRRRRNLTHPHQNTRNYMENLEPIENPEAPSPEIDAEKVMQFDGRYKGKDIILAAAMVTTSKAGKPEIDPRWFTLLFIGSDGVRKFAKRLLEMKDGEEFMFFVENPPIKRGSL